MGALDQALPIVGTIGAPALLTFIVLMVLNDKLVPGNRLKQLREDHAVVDTERKATIAALREQLNVSLQHNTLLIKGSETTRHVVESLPGREVEHDAMALPEQG